MTVWETNVRVFRRGSDKIIIIHGKDINTHVLATGCIRLEENPKDEMFWPALSVSNYNSGE